MTQHLEILKGILQKALNSSTESDCYQEALSDGIYACQLYTSTGLEQWMNIWLTGLLNYAYTKGVQFVAQEWENVLSQDNQATILKSLLTAPQHTYTI